MENTYGTLQSMVEELTRQNEVKKDFIVPARDITMKQTVNQPIVAFGDDEAVPTSRFHAQVSAKTKIPKQYYDRMLAESPALLSENVNHWLGESDKNHMIRTLDGKARAFLSDRFFRMDNLFVLNAILPNLNRDMNLEFKTNTLTDDRMYLQIIFRSMQKDVKVGDTMAWGLSFTNSETGLSAFDVKTFLFRLSCLNGMVGQSLLRKFHVGRKIDSEDGYELFEKDTLQAEIRALELKTRDIVGYALNSGEFDKQVEALKIAAGDEVRKPERVIQNVTQRFDIPERFREMMLENMVQEKEFSRYGVANAVTSLAHSLTDADQQYEIEKIGSKIISLSPSEWRVVAEAA